MVCHRGEPPRMEPVDPSRSVDRVPWKRTSWRHVNDHRCASPWFSMIISIYTYIYIYRFIYIYIYNYIYIHIYIYLFIYTYGVYMAIYVKLFLWPSYIIWFLLGNPWMFSCHEMDKTKLSTTSERCFGGLPRIDHVIKRPSTFKWVL